MIIIVIELLLHNEHRLPSFSFLFLLIVFIQMSESFTPQEFVIFLQFAFLLCV